MHTVTAKPTGQSGDSVAVIYEEPADGTPEEGRSFSRRP